MTLQSNADRGRVTERDWAGRLSGLVLVWGLPIGAMLGAIALDPLPKTLVWMAALGWMGVACLLNARRCGRTHCYYTGPFFLIMILPVALHGFAVMPLGPDGWQWLGMAVGIGGGCLWCLTEAAFGRYRKGDEGPRR